LGAALSSFFDSAAGAGAFSNSGIGAAAAAVWRVAASAFVIGDNDAQKRTAARKDFKAAPVLMRMRNDECEMKSGPWAFAVLNVRSAFIIPH
jgi:hypothetical protein